MARIRAVVVEDSITIRKRLVEVLAMDPEIEVVAEAGNGRQAIELCQEMRPDVITMDMMLPVMTGLAATEYIMAHVPTPILIVSASTNRGELFRTYEALAAGAVDVLEKPGIDEPEGCWEARLVATVKLVSRIKVITHLRRRLALDGPARGSRHAVPAPAPRADIRVVAVGASTGGPGAVVEILRALPAPYPIPLLLVVHIGEPFGVAFAEWLDGQSRHRVRCAVDGEKVAAADFAMRMAPPGRHLVVDGDVLRLTADPARHSCRPSVDVLFESVARTFGAACAGCLLTGMGRDGAAGLLALRRAGGRTMAQDEASSVVYGMPREAALIGAVEQVLPLGEIGPAIARLGRVT